MNLTEKLNSLSQYVENFNKQSKVYMRFEHYIWDGEDCFVVTISKDNTHSETICDTNNVQKAITAIVAVTKFAKYMDK